MILTREHQEQVISEFLEEKPNAKPKEMAAFLMGYIKGLDKAHQLIKHHLKK